MYKVLFIVLFVIYTGYVQAAPVITEVQGGFFKGQQIVIQGTGFGSVGPNIKVFDTFSGIPGNYVSNIATKGTWTANDGPTFIQDGDEVSALLMNGTASKQMELAFPATQEFFLSYRTKIPTGYHFPNTTTLGEFAPDSAWKMAWIMDGPTSAPTDDDVILPTWGDGTKFYMQGNDTGIRISGVVDQLPVGRPGELDNWFSFSGWNTFSVYMKAGVDPINDVGIVKAQGLSQEYGLKQFSWNNATLFDGDDETGDDAISQWDYLNIPGWFRTAGANAAYDSTTRAIYDDIYFASGPGAQARVEIGNASTYTACTKLAIIYPNAWSDTQITAEVYNGEFRSGDTLYVYVIDADGNISLASGPYLMSSVGISNASMSAYSLSISGYGFGAKVQAAPIRFDNFEGLTEGNNVSSETGWWLDSTVVASRMKVSAAQSHGGSKSAVASQTWQQITVDGNPQIHKSDVGFASTRKVLVSMWVRWKWPEWANGTPYEALQYKLFRVASTVEPSGNVIYPHVAVFPWKDYAGLNIDRTLITSNSATIYSPNNHLIDNAWHHITLLIDQGTKGNSDGKIITYWSKPANNYITVQSEDNVNIVGSAEDYLDDIKIDNYIDYNNALIVSSGATVSNSGMYFDDIYIDNTFQRVEICDAPTKEASTHCELQPPVLWSDSNITLTLNRGTFQPGNNVYIIVYNNDNTPGSYGPIAMSPVAGWAKARMKLQN